MSSVLPKSISELRPTAREILLAGTTSGVCVSLVGMAWGWLSGVMLLVGMASAYALICGDRTRRLRQRLDLLDREKQVLEEELASREERELELRETLAEREAALAQKPALAEANTNRVNNAFVASLSHEIRTPMGAIVGLAELLFTGDLGQEQREQAKTIHGSAKSLLTLLDDLYDFSRIEAGHFELVSEPFSLRGTVQEVVDLLYPRAFAKGIGLTCLVDPELRDSVCGDASRVRQVLTHLIGNSVRYTQHGRVEVEVSGATAAASAENQQPRVEVAFRIRDTGEGISEEKCKQLFEPFWGEEAIFKKRGETGLGLAIAQQLTRLMGGGIDVESHASEGSTFTVRLSLELAEEERESRSEVHALRGKRLLVLASSATERRVVRVFAEAAGMTVSEEAEPEDALDALEEATTRGAPIDVVVVDNDLPGVLGKELATRIRAEQSFRDSRLVLMHGIDSNVKPSSLVRAGLDAWIAKPVHSRKLEQALLVALEESTQNEPKAPLPAPTKPRTSHSRGVRILLAEDNLVNQKVATLLLKKLGCCAEITNNGLEAVEAVRQGSFDLVFMDCQMPVMSGFQATESIRALDDVKRRSIPIVAMTANALQGDRERCLEVGMNDYLSKPVQLEDLGRVLEQWAPVERAHPSETEEGIAMNDAKQDNLLDQSVLASLRELGGEDDPGLFVELVELFLEDTPSRISDLGEAFESGDANAVERAAHALKSSAANLGAMQLSELFRELEEAGRSEDLGRAGALIDQSKDVYDRVRDALQAEIA